MWPPEICCGHDHLPAYSRQCGGVEHLRQHRKYSRSLSLGIRTQAQGHQGDNSQMSETKKITLEDVAERERAWQTEDTFSSATSTKTMRN